MFALPDSRHDFVLPACENPCFQLYRKHSGFGVFRALDTLAKHYRHYSGKTEKKKKNMMKHYLKVTKNEVPDEVWAQYGKMEKVVVAYKKDRDAYPIFNFFCWIFNKEFRNPE